MNTNFASGSCQSSTEPGKYEWAGGSSKIVVMPRNKLAGKPGFSTG